MSFNEKLKRAWAESGSLLCVGLDPDMDKLPETAKQASLPIFHFCRAIVDATADLVCAFKPQIAYFHAAGAEHDLEALIDYMRDRYPRIPIILDAKRGDIGSTAKQYAHEAFDRYRADAVTANPYMGGDSLQPFLDYADRGIFLLCRTSNPGGADVQELEVAGRPVYEHVAEMAANKWNAHNNIGLVVGATQPQPLRRVRALIGDMPLLVPGVGSQGGDPRAVLEAASTSNGTGLIVNVSRAVLYAGQGADYADEARKKAQQIRESLKG
ncbi:MAG: orotidine 5'-phosphate decarboxylase [Lysobacteraceae bacterium]|nr:MAG: orotidine 5'-phosphate decarboxylase [Xanthomonadaceae bacterium]